MIKIRVLMQTGLTNRIIKRKTALKFRIRISFIKEPHKILKEH